eukprot:320139-Ditylum_brightwellii.AAC.1
MPKPLQPPNQQQLPYPAFERFEKGEKGRVVRMMQTVKTQQSTRWHEKALHHGHAKDHERGQQCSYHN